MKYGEKYTWTSKDIFGETHEWKSIYRYASWGDYHTNNEGEGLWYKDQQILGTCQFSVCGCQQEKSAIAKIRRWVRGTYPEREKISDEDIQAGWDEYRAIMGDTEDEEA